MSQMDDTIKYIVKRLAEAYTSMDYRRATDEELVELSKKKDQRATNELLGRYENLIKKMSRDSGLFALGGTPEDLAQEGLVGFWKAIGSYEKGKNKNFKQYALLIAKREMIDAARSASRKKNSPLNQAEDITQIERPSKHNPEQSYINKEDYKKLQSFIKTGLTDLEQKVLALYLQGYNYEEIGKKLGKNRKSADNAMNMVRSKLRRQGYSGKLRDSRIIALIESILLESDKYTKIPETKRLRESIVRLLLLK